MQQQINVVFPAPLVSAIDDWRRQQKDCPSRNEAIRRVLAEALLYGASLVEERKRVADIRNG
jgi:metal-responsive CopG/Arc/MetJ family transcriptional regulator